MVVPWLWSVLPAHQNYLSGWEDISWMTSRVHPSAMPETPLGDDTPLGGEVPLGAPQDDAPLPGIILDDDTTGEAPDEKMYWIMGNTIMLGLALLCLMWYNFQRRQKAERGPLELTKEEERAKRLRKLEGTAKGCATSAAPAPQPGAPASPEAAPPSFQQAPAPAPSPNEGEGPAPAPTPSPNAGKASASAPSPNAGKAPAPAPTPSPNAGKAPTARKSPSAQIPKKASPDRPLPPPPPPLRSLPQELGAALAQTFGKAEAEAENVAALLRTEDGHAEDVMDRLAAGLVADLVAKHPGCNWLGKVNTAWSVAQRARTKLTDGSRAAPRDAAQSETWEKALRVLSVASDQLARHAALRLAIGEDALYDGFSDSPLLEANRCPGWVDLEPPILLVELGRDTIAPSFAAAMVECRPAALRMPALRMRLQVRWAGHPDNANAFAPALNTELLLTMLEQLRGGGDTIEAQARQARLAFSLLSSIAARLAPAASGCE